MVYCHAMQYNDTKRTKHTILNPQSNMTKLIWLASDQFKTVSPFPLRVSQKTWQLFLR